MPPKKGGATMDDTEGLDTVNAGASDKYPAQASTLRKGGFMMINKRPCKIVEMSTSKTGKHGHAKIHFVTLDIFTNKKIEDIVPSTHNTEVPHVNRQDFQLTYIEDGFLILMDDSGVEKSDIKVPDTEIGREITKIVDDDSDNLMVTILSACGEEAVIAHKPMK